MALQSRIDELSARHQDLEFAIDQELKHPGVDSVRLTAMKKEKLKLKDEIAQLEFRDS